MLGQANSLSLGAVQQKLGHIAKNHKLYLAYYCDHFVYQAKQELIIAKKVNMVMFVFKVLIMQLVHSSMTNLAYYYHQPAPTLYDLGFATLPPLSKEDQIYSEYILLWTILALVAFAVSVFVAPLPTEERLQAFLAGSPIQPYSRVPTSTSNDADDTGEAKNTHSGSSSNNNNDNHGQTDVRISMPGGDVSSFVFRSTEYFVMLARRFGLCLCCAQVLRSLSFIVTSLPAPNYHCRVDSTTYSPPMTYGEILFRTDAFLGCGDLIFSSHTTFVLLCALSVTYYGGHRFIKRAAWGLVVFFSVMCIMARKHYSVDVVIALYTVPMLYDFLYRHFPDHKLVDRSTVSKLRENHEARYGMEGEGAVELGDMHHMMDEKTNDTGSSMSARVSHGASK